MYLNLDFLYKGDAFPVTVAKSPLYPEHQYKLVLRADLFNERIVGQDLGDGTVNFVITSDISDSMPVGQIGYRLIAFSAEESRTIETGQIEVKDPENTDSFISDNQKRLDSLQSIIDGFIKNGAINSYSYDGKSVTREDLPALIAERDRLFRAVSIAKNPSKAKLRPIKIRFR